MSALYYYETGSTWAPYNLALEEVLMESVQTGGPGCFFLWQNGPSVIIGRHQNALSEVNLPELGRRRIDLVRRMTGGGAVYHDLGNLNFSFILPLGRGQEIKPADLLAPMMDYFGGQGLEVRMEGRNDLSIPGRGKFSGLAGRRAAGAYQLHGTIMYDVDLGVLEQVLLVDPEKFKSKGVASVRARVVNLKGHLGLSLPDLRQGIRAAYELSPAPIEAAIMTRARRLADEKYSRDSWNIGRWPAADIFLKRRFSFGSLELHLGISRDRIASAVITGDFLSPSELADQIPVESLARALLGLPADRPSSWAEAWASFDFGQIFYGRVKACEITNWLKEALVPNSGPARGT